jgi:pimeloyl-ACP methyl ester carboxylesterase
MTVAGSRTVAGLVYVAASRPTWAEVVNDPGALSVARHGPARAPGVVADGGVEASSTRAGSRLLLRRRSDAIAHSRDARCGPGVRRSRHAAAWRAKPSWAVFGTADRPVAPELHRFSYDRAGSTVTEVEDASHFVMLSQPDIVAGVIHEAVMACATNPVAS